MSIPQWLEQRGVLFWILIGVALTACIGTVDFLTGNELGVALFYLIPISLVTWYTVERTGIAFSILAAAALFFADFFGGRTYSTSAFYVWNALVRFAFFLVVVILLNRLRIALLRERELSQRDSLTGAGNARMFYRALDSALGRPGRIHCAVSVAYLDLDNFKRVNDAAGHAAGDQVLCDVVACMRNHLRSGDVIARLGGDEFALLLPETDKATAQTVISNIKDELVKEMERRGFAVTPSFGVVTCDKPSATAQELINQADNLMYLAKSQGKNSVRYALYADPTSTGFNRAGRVTGPRKT